MANDIKTTGEFSSLTLQTTSLAAGAVLSVEGFSKIGFQFKCVPSIPGVGTFSVAGTIDGTQWTDINTLIDNVTNANSEQLTRVASKDISSLATSAIVWMDNMAFKAVRVGVNIATNGSGSPSGSYSATIIANN